MTLRDYQERISTEAADKLKEFGCCYLAMECRTGKTLTALVAAQKFGAKCVLFITKKKAIGSVTRDFALLSADGVRPFDFEAINYESCQKHTTSPDLVILDEAHCMGAYPKPGVRTKAVKEVCAGKPVIFLSGTPTPESYSQLYHQFWVCEYSPFRQYKNFYAWARSGFVNVQKRIINGFWLNDYSDADKRQIDEATAHLFLTYTQEQAGFTCEIDEEDLICPVNSHTVENMRLLKRHKVLHLGAEDVILGDTPAKLMNKLHQLSGGTIITEDGRRMILDRSKARYIKDHFHGKKIAIFYLYQSELDLLTEVFPNHTESPEEFQASDNLTFISQIRKAREGVRLDTADAIVFYNLEYSYLSYEQGRNRIVSSERTSPAKVYFAITDGGLERDILNAVRNKSDFTYSWFLRYGEFN